MSIEPKKLSQFEQLPSEIQTLVMKCLNSQEMGTSSAAIAVFRKLMEKNETWLQIATKLNVHIVDPKKAKQEFLQKYAETKAVNDVFMQFLPSQIATTNDPFALRQIIEKFILENKNNAGIIKVLEAFLGLITGNVILEEPEKEITILMLKLGVQPLQDLHHWAKTYVRPAAEVDLEIFRAVLPLEDQLYRLGDHTGPHLLLKWAVNEDQSEHAKAILEEGFMPLDADLPLVLDWALMNLTEPSYEVAAMQLCHHADSVIAQLQKAGKPFEDIQKKIAQLRG